MSALEALLTRLDAVQRSGNGWRAKCPVCGGRERKVSVTEGDGGKVLVRCFGGCAVLSVTQALGLAMADLFPERLRDNTPSARRKALRAAREAQWGAALEVLDVEAAVILIAGRQVTYGRPLSADDAARLAVAVTRVANARGVLRDTVLYRPSRRAA